ncbi:GerAB/ArcD/ProY family transporter [Alkaliphilus serpentinus]|uniref:GerAB/ArcD/ProY family transporter n=1 Tax=Alkaliphilus serpentinus TaxID=1482731 RepID=A0A833M988_9FIRM|nr:endospore germination permease [Alkaliphilus serpentinus]KAB3527265.1 GerAB/ArcD/ProY family transporter [Alkaliphilus serpentinus]
MDKFNSKHIPFLVLATMIVSIKTYPTIYTKNGGRDSWVAMIIASIIFLAFIVYVVKGALKHNCFNVYRIYTSAVGKSLGSFLVGLLVVTFFLTLVESAAVFSNSLHNHMLIDTPIWYFLLFFIPATLYTVKRDLVAIITVTLIGITLVTISGINLAMLTAQYKRFDYLFPIFDRGLTVGFIKCTLQILALFGGSLTILPYLKKLGETKKLVKYLIYSLLFAFQIHLVSLTGLFMTFDVHFVNYMTYPNLFQTQLVSHFRFLEMGELFVMLQIVGGWYLKYVITFYAMLSIIRDMKIETRKIVYYVSGLVFVLGYFIGNDLFFLFRMLNIYTYIALANFIIIPLFIFPIFSKKGLQVPSDTSAN